MLLTYYFPGLGVDSVFTYPIPGLGVSKPIIFQGWGVGMLFTYYFPGLGVDSVVTYHNCRVGELGGFSSKLEEILLFLLRDARDMRNHSLFINYFSNFRLIILVRLYLIFLQYAFINFVINSTELRHNSIHLNLISEFSIVQIQTSACHISTVVCRSYLKFHP